MRSPLAFRVYLTLSGASTLFNATMFTVLTVYYVQVAALNPLQLVLLGTVMEVSEFLFEVPTGIVADTYSRRLSVIIGMFITGAAFVMVGLVNSFELIALGLAIYGLGSTFLSGAREAWIVDEVGEEEITYVFLRSAQVRRLASLIGIFISVGLASIQLNLPIVLGGVLTMLLALYLTIVMPETGYRSLPRSGHNPLKVMQTVLGDTIQLLRSTPAMLWFLAIGVMFGAYAEIFDRLGDAHFLLNLSFPQLGNLEPVVWFGLISAGAQLLGFVAAGGAAQWLHVEGTTRIVRALLVLQVLWIISAIAFALAGNFLSALVAYWAVAVVSTIHGPIYQAWLNQHLDSRVRATALSLINQADAAGQFTGGPAIGLIGTIYSLRVALVVAGLVLSPAFLLYSQALASEKATQNHTGF